MGTGTQEALGREGAPRPLRLTFSEEDSWDASSPSLSRAKALRCLPWVLLRSSSRFGGLVPGRPGSPASLSRSGSRPS